MHNRTGTRRIARASNLLAAAFLRSCMAVFILCVSTVAMGQMGTPTPLPPAERQKAEAESKATGSLANYPHLVDITDSTGIHFEHLSSTEAKCIAESMSGGVALIDYDRDGWPDIYFTNAQSVEMAQHGEKSRSALYRNNHDGNFTDVTDKAGVGYPCWAQGAVVGDYNNDGWPDLLVTCFGGVVLYRNNGDGTFADVTASAGVGGGNFLGHGRRVWRLRWRRLAGSVCLALRRVGSARSASLRLDGKLHLLRNQGSVR